MTVLRSLLVLIVMLLLIIQGVIVFYVCTEHYAATMDVQAIRTNRELLDERQKIVELHEKMIVLRQKHLKEFEEIANEQLLQSGRVLREAEIKLDSAMEKLRDANEQLRKSKEKIQEK